MFLDLVGNFSRETIIFLKANTNARNKKNVKSLLSGFLAE